MKHFIGVPNLSLYEISPFHDATAVFEEMLGLGEPCVFFEDKVLYTRQMGEMVAPFTCDVRDGVARVSCGGPPDCVIIAPGGMAQRTMRAMHTLLVQDEINALLLVPSRLYPFDDPFASDMPAAGSVFVVEESTGGGTWGAEVAHQIHTRHWGSLDRPVTLIHSRDSVIPTASHLERDVLVGESTIYQAITGAMRG